MDFEEYIKLTRETAIYPESYERNYVIHGLVDEAGELKETVESKPNRKSTSSVQRSRFGGLHVKQICDELGDVMWYAARGVDHFEFDPERFINANLKQFTPMNQEAAEEETDKLLLAAARMNGNQKKSVRDGDNRENRFNRNLKKVVLKAQKVAHHSGIFDLRVVMERNIEKLFDRKARDVLQGDGDNR
jgi:NTP pyrophosphatase (non-canonical NTP hydrolase)